MAKDTKNKICKAALALFSNNQFEVVSIAEICRYAQVSNGVYYRYFKNKEELLRILIDDFLIQFEKELTDIQGTTIEEKVLRFITIILKVGKEHKQEIAIFREGQYRLYGYEDTLRKLYIRSAEFVFERTISEVEYLYIVSGLRFCSTRVLYNNKIIDPEYIRDFILNGVFPHMDMNINISNIAEQFNSVFEEEPDSSYEKLIRCGIFLFGKSGFHKIGVADITSECRLAVGTFYTYFESKEKFLNTIVLHIGERTRHYLSKNVHNHGNRLDQEILGIWHFLNYFRNHLEYYSIVREAEFVGKEVVSQYYDAFEHGYLKNLDSISEEKRIHAANFLIGLSHYTGIEVLHRERINDIPRFLVEMSLLLKNGISFN